jgi:tRNA A-37 threonylcarbamoyl transferase component Bud32
MNFETELQQKFPHFTIVPLGNTKHANVLKLTSPKGENYVAKTIWHDHGDPEGDLGIKVMDQRYRTEVKILGMLPSWWGLRLYDHFKTKENRVIVTSEIPNLMPWSSYKKNTKNDRHIANLLLKQLRWLHSNQIAHDDLELKNVLLTTDGKAIIIDFEKSFFRASTEEMRADYTLLMSNLSERSATQHIAHCMKKQTMASRKYRRMLSKTLKV